jgi:hypothetical protein
MFPVWRGKLSGLPFLIAKKLVAEVKEKQKESSEDGAGLAGKKEKLSGITRD